MRCMLHSYMHSQVGHSVLVDRTTTCLKYFGLSTHVWIMHLALRDMLSALQYTPHSPYYTFIRYKTVLQRRTSCHLCPPLLKKFTSRWPIAHKLIITTLRWVCWVPQQAHPGRGMLRKTHCGTSNLAAQVLLLNYGHIMNHTCLSGASISSSPSLWVCKGIPAFHLFHKFLVPNPLTPSSIHYQQCMQISIHLHITCDDKFISCPFHLCKICNS